MKRIWGWILGGIALLVSGFMIFSRKRERDLVEKIRADRDKEKAKIIDMVARHDSDGLAEEALKEAEEDK